MARYPEVFWTEEYAPPLIKGYAVNMKEKEGSVPVARQTIPLSPYDEMRVEFH